MSVANGRLPFYGIAVLNDQPVIVEILAGYADGPLIAPLRGEHAEVWSGVAKIPWTHIFALSNNPDSPELTKWLMAMDMLKLQYEADTETATTAVETSDTPGGPEHQTSTENAAEVA